MEFPLNYTALRAAMPRLDPIQAHDFLPALQQALNEFEINTRTRVCSFLAHIGHESMDLTRWRENMNYSAERLLQVFPKHFSVSAARAFQHRPELIANRVYGGRMGNNRDGDGWKYIARGPLGITGRDMYRRAGAALGLDLENYPELAEGYEQGFRVAAWIWAVEKGCNELADQLRGTADKRELQTITAQTKRINGGTNGLSDRWLRYGKILRAVHFAVTPPPPPYAPANPQPPASPPPPPPRDFDDVLKDVDKPTVLSVLRRGWLFLWRPVVTVFVAAAAGDIKAISTIAVVLLVVILLLFLYRKHLWSAWLRVSAAYSKLGTGSGDQSRGPTEP